MVRCHAMTDAPAPLDPALACPSCRAPMSRRAVASNLGLTITLDVCHACRGLWFDHGESLRLAPQGVVELFRELHMHKDDAQTPLARPHAFAHLYDLSPAGALTVSELNIPLLAPDAPEPHDRRDG